jgi:hypothetical protein
MFNDGGLNKRQSLPLIVGGSNRFEALDGLLITGPDEAKC